MDKVALFTELVAKEVVRGDIWTLGVFHSRSGTTWWGHVKWMDSGFTQLGFASKEKAAAWVVETFEQVVRERGNYSPAEAV